MAKRNGRSRSGVEAKRRRARIRRRLAFVAARRAMFREVMRRVSEMTLRYLSEPPPTREQIIEATIARFQQVYPGSTFLRMEGDTIIMSQPVVERLITCEIGFRNPDV